MEQVKLISDYVLRTYFKHYKLYKYAFTKRVTLSMKLVYDGKEEEEEKEEEEAEEEEKEETLSQVEDAEKEEVDGEEGEKSKGKGKNNPFDNAILVWFLFFLAEEEKLTPEQQRLQEMISASLNDHLKQLQVWTILISRIEYFVVHSATSYRLELFILKEISSCH